MIAVLNAVNAGPWPGDTAPDTDGFRDATEIIVAMRRRLAAETRSTDDARRYRAACRAVERIARGRDVPRIAVEAERLSAVLGYRLYPRRSSSCASTLDGFSRRRS
jgi:hypothetical protein